MPRRPRIYLPGIPTHVIQRGNNRSVCFFHDEDYRFYLELLATGLKRYKVRLHAYVLMTNHVHLLMTPDEENSISRLMQHLGRLYVLYINKTYRRSGTLWEGRHKSSLVDAERYLLACHRYIELNPVKAAMVEHPAAYPWSSYRHNANGIEDALVTHHPLYLALGPDAADRQRNYADLFLAEIPAQTDAEIRVHLERSYPLGNDRFRREIEFALGRKVGQLTSGRPSAGLDQG